MCLVYTYSFLIMKALKIYIFSPNKGKWLIYGYSLEGLTKWISQISNCGLFLGMLGYAVLTEHEQVVILYATGIT